MDVDEIGTSRTITKMVRTDNGSYVRSADLSDILESYTGARGTDGSNFGYTLFDADSAYKLTQSYPEKMHLHMNYENAYISTELSEGSSCLFDKKGYVVAEGDSTDYRLSITMNELYPTDWFTVAVSGQDADKASFEVVSGGYVLASDNLNNVKVEANNKVDEASTTFSTEYPSVFIYEIDKDTIGIRVDTDSNGTYETLLNTNATDVSNASVTLKQSVYAYDGSAKTPGVVVKVGSRTLVQGTDYTVSYTNNVKVGTARVTVTGKGRYSGSISRVFKIRKASLKYRAYVQKKSWTAWQEALYTTLGTGGTAGSYDDLRMETIQLKLSGIEGYVSYRAYVQREAWTKWARTDKNGAYAGTKGKGLRVEAIQMKLAGDVGKAYDIYYRSYSDHFGWLGWAKNGNSSGTAGYAYKLKAFQIKLLPKGSTAPSGSGKNAFIKKG